MIIKLSMHWFQACVSEIAMSDHTGRPTHVDAPAHMLQDGKYITDLPLEKFIAPGVVIDFSNQTQANSDAMLSVQDIEGNHSIFYICLSVGVGVCVWGGGCT